MAARRFSICTCICSADAVLFSRRGDRSVIMKNFVLLAIFALVFQFGCGGSGGDSNSAVNSAQPDLVIAEITDANVALTEGNRLFDANRTEDAIAAFQKAVELNPDLGEAYFKMGIAFALIEKRDAGI